MIDFIVNNYYLILVICILLIFALIGYITDTLKRRKYEENAQMNQYVAEEEVFLQTSNKLGEEETKEEEIHDEVEDLLKEYNNETKDENAL